MFKLNIVKMILYFTSAAIYAMIFVLMHFFDVLHDFYFQFIILGSILLVLFIITRGRHNFTKTQIIASLFFIGALLAQIIIETLRFEEVFQRQDLLHLLFHIVVAVAYFVFAHVMYFELTKSYKNTVLRQASFDYNDAILFEYDATQHMIQIELSDNIYKNYGLSKKSYKIDY